MFDDELHYDFEQQALTAFAGHSTTGGWGVRVALGAVAGGSLEGDELPGEHDVEPGLIGSATGSRRWAFGDGSWFATGSLTLAAAATGTEMDGTSSSDDLTALDLRAGAIAGRTFAELVSPYVLGRVFGGPVYWSVAGEDVTGTDTHHYQVGAGVNLHTGFGLTAIVDLALLGEQSASLGLSWQL